MRISQYISDFLATQHYSANTERAYRYRLLALSRHEDEVGIPLHNMTPAQLTDAFGRLRGNPYIMQSVIKLVGQYFDWLESEGVDSSIGKASLKEIDHKKVGEDRTRLFFYSAQQLLSKINADTKSVASITGRLPTDFRMPVAVLLLSWVGLKIPDIVNVRKTNIHKDNTITMHGGRFPVDPQIIEHLLECASAAGHTWLNGYAVCLSEYRDSQYLIRTSERRKVSEQYARWLVSDFNRKLPTSSDPYKIDRIYWSGIFARAYQRELEMGGFPKEQSPDQKMEFYGKLFKEEYTTTTQVRLRLNEYEIYTSILRE